MSTKNTKCGCIAIIMEVLPVREIAELVSSYVPHRTDADIICMRLHFGMKEWTVKANDEFIPEKDRDRKTTFNITRQEVTLKICMRNSYGFGRGITLEMDEMCNRYHGGQSGGIMVNSDTYDPKEVLSKPWEHKWNIEHSSPLFARMIERVRVVMNERILAILAKADRHCGI